MKFDEDWHDGFKGFSFVLGIILILLVVAFAIMLIVFTADSLSRYIALKNIATWKSKGCYIVDVKTDTPIYKCGVKDDN